MGRKCIALRVAMLAIGIMVLPYKANEQESELDSISRTVEAFVEKRRTDKYAVLDSVTEDGGNLRQYWLVWTL